MRLLAIASIVFAFLLIQAAHAQSAEPNPKDQADQAPYIRSALPLDEPRHLCIDLPGHGASANPNGSFSVHTCKDGMWNYDQRFRWTKDGSSLRMPQYGKCLAVSEAKAGANIVLAACGSENAKFISENARLKLQANPLFCLTIANVRSELTPGGKRFPERYRSRPLSLELCSQTAIERQLWSVTQPLDLKTALLPPKGSLSVNKEQVKASKNKEDRP
ncbi:ricin-type beta-trefoil lectin domain protein [Hellea balneolensis]|uniref:ricin-type beta-trefoil lectin domain protein n=1 Tax=Hellea balneolensis TaxID=287478 RepID=UPI00040CB7AF|nr:ricin-type beta-trefoil lectin domain protein [Hellea balneolensis]